MQHISSVPYGQLIIEMLTPSPPTATEPAPAEPTVSASGTTDAPTALVSATAAGLASAIAVLVATTPAAPNDPLFTSGAVPDSSTKNGPQLEYLALLSLLTIPLLLAFIRYVRRRAASEATKGPDSVSFSSRFSHVTAVTSGLSVLQVVTPDTLSEIVAATREEARAVAREEAVKVAAAMAPIAQRAEAATGLPGGVRSQRRNSI